MDENKVRLHKYLSAAGICSRRKAEQYILEGLVQVNNSIVKELGTKINPLLDLISFNGQEVNINTQKIYILFNKPKGCVTTVSDPEGRPTVMDYIKAVKERVFPIGRLDFNTEGLLLFTNDGEFANQLLHPSFLIVKKYFVTTEKLPNILEIRKLENGIQLEYKKLAKSRIVILDQKLFPCSMEVSIHEGLNKQIRRMFQKIGYEVTYLKRTQIGGLYLGNLKTGTFRYLQKKDLETVFKSPQI
ncbi:MAG: pseudouridine synthase [Flavobacterium sp.]|nr:pseudouridine synthase [Flavobacterium sp.]